MSARAFPARPRVGVLAVQGAFAEHRRACAEVGADAVEVRRADQLDGLSGLVIPGGETTTLRIVAGESGLLDALRAARADGLPMLGTCAGLIALADRIEDGDPPLVGGLDVTVRRNAYGRQVASFEAVLHTPGLGDGALTAVFIRAPRIVHSGPKVEIIAAHAGTPVAVRQGNLMGVAFHPELTDDRRFHVWLVQRAREREAGNATQTEGGRRVGAQ